MVNCTDINKNIIKNNSGYPAALKYKKHDAGYFLEA